jgi:hypothetical protein
MMLNSAMRLLKQSIYFLGLSVSPLSNSRLCCVGLCSEVLRQRRDRRFVKVRQHLGSQLRCRGSHNNRRNIHGFRFSLNLLWLRITEILISQPLVIQEFLPHLRRKMLKEARIDSERILGFLFCLFLHLGLDLRLRLCLCRLLLRRRLVVDLTQDRSLDLLR